MTPEMVVSIGRDAVLTMLLVSAPMLLSGLLVGLVISLLQAVTQVHEMTLTFIPKIVAVAVSLIIFLPWIMNVVTEFTVRLFGIIPTL
ncbi:MAG: flagellar biosynthetic protein FliQ [Candidatus Zixiibacteriota bacterium]|nr:MAG: flagellar biosynthetic protein FliQ [candidate division Zixibacteria bacterium]HDL03541.1 flagellar biosynthesis protein FliQ [candidate division Zixibacteria bacterium]